MNKMHCLLSALCLATCLAFANTQIFPRVADCTYSAWSEYFLDPENSQQVFRTRRILVHPRGGGRACTGDLRQTAPARDLATPTLSKFLSEFIPGDRRKVSLGGRLLGRGEVPRSYVLQRDIVIVIDMTLFVPALPPYKLLLSNLVGAVCGEIGNATDKNIFSLITYDTSRTDVLHAFRDNQTKLEIQNKILNITPPKPGNGKASLLSNAMRLAGQQISSAFTGTRLYNIAHKDVVLFVTYRTVCSAESVDEAAQIAKYGRLYVVVLGESGDGTAPPNGWCLAHFASRAFDTHFLWVRNFDELREFSAWTLDISSYRNPCDPNGQYMEV